MIPAPFEYAAPESVAEAITLLQQRPGEGKIIAGGQSLLPMMKLRLAMPGLVVDLRKTADELSHISADGGILRIGSMTTHARVAASDVVRNTVPLLAETAAEIADVQVRSLGTIGGSIAHADPVADYPAALLALDAQAQVVGPNGARVVSIDELILDAFITMLAEDEIITEITIPIPDERAGSAYLKFANKASHFAIVGVAAVVEVDEAGRLARVAVGITGAASRAARATAVEDALRGQDASSEAITSASALAADGLECIADLHGSPEYRQNLCRVLTRRALMQAVERAGD